MDAPLITTWANAQPGALSIKEMVQQGNLEVPRAGADAIPSRWFTRVPEPESNYPKGAGDAAPGGCMDSDAWEVGGVLIDPSRMVLCLHHMGSWMNHSCI